MPHVRIELLAGRTEDQKAELVSEITESLCRIVQANRNNVTVVFHDVEPSNWGHNSVLVSRRE